MNKGSKLLIIGLDGASFNTFDLLKKKGVSLPYIDGLIANGVKGDLTSTIPPVTAPAWVSFMTGKNPGKHGIFDFIKITGADMGRRVISYNDIEERTLWSILSDAGKKVIVINFPITYPPPKVEGFLVSGMMTPLQANRFTYPASFQEEIKRIVGDYVIDVMWQDYKESEAATLVEDILNSTKQKGRLAGHLMANSEWDFFAIVFEGPDRIQHALWDVIEGNSRNNGTKVEERTFEKIASYYQELDSIIGNLVNGSGERTSVIIMSDHGFGPLNKKFYINKWLRDQGYLTLKARNKVGSLYYRFNNIVKKLQGSQSVYPFMDQVDWHKTRAYSASNSEQGIYINVKGCEPFGIVEPGIEYEMLRKEIMSKLTMIKDPDTGELLASRVLRREEVYYGHRTKDAPDIICFLKEGEYLMDIRLRDKLVEEAKWQTGTGTHRMNGVFIANGKGIKKGSGIDGARIIDIAPTALFLLDQPIPEDMDGRVLINIFEGSVQPVFCEGRAKDSSNTPSSVSDIEEADIASQLKGLGYLD